MQTWLDIEQRLRSLVPTTKYLRIDFQWGAAGEHWYIGGIGEHPTISHFEALARIAGTLLGNALSVSTENSVVLSEPNPSRRWYRALKEWSGSCEFLHFVQQMNDNGENAGSIYTGRINNVVEVSANFCLQLHSHYPIPNTSSHSSNMTVTNYVVNSQVGFLNSGEIHHIKSITANAESLQKQGQQNVAEAIVKILSAIADSDELTKELKATTLDQVEEISRQAALKPNERAKPGVLRALFAGIDSTLTTVSSVSDIWSTWGTSIKDFLQL